MSTVHNAKQDELELFDADNADVASDATDAGLDEDAVTAINYIVAAERSLVADGFETVEQANQHIDEAIADITYGDEQVTAIGDDPDVQLVG